ncbi:MAG: transcription antitermination factor NusB [Saprospiraceae bacterium]|nr:transcription antitermination factor NusB [Saprospiraceae bacterium]
MLSRRHIRIKVMQLLYAKSRDIDLSLSDLLSRYQSYGNRTLELYLFNLQQLIETAHYSVRDELNRRAKYSPTEDDKKFTPKLYQNEVLQGFLANGTYNKAIKKFHLSGRTEGDTIAHFYRKFLETDIYRNYLANPNTTTNDDRQVLLELYKFLYKNEMFDEAMEDFSTSWIDDDSLVIGTTKKTIKAMPSDAEFIYDFTEEDKLTFAFGEELLTKTYNKDIEILELIKPMLKNWDAERVATIDMISLKMATAELLYFPTIPTKVTINEYVDVSKMYSTDKSKEFVNGILDRLMKQLKDDGLIRKEGRGLIE